MFANACRTFADGFPDVFIENALDIRNQHVAFLASFYNPAHIFEQVCGTARAAEIISCMQCACW